MVQKKSPILGRIALAASLAAALLAIGCGAGQNGVGGGPDFSLSGPSSMTVNQGSQTTGTITVTATGGFTGTVALTASGLPTGVTAIFSPTSVTGSGSSTLTVTAAGNATLGNSSFTVTGTSGSDVHNLPVQLTVQKSGGGGGTNACSITTTSSLPGSQALFGDNRKPTTFLVIGLSIPVDCFTSQMSYYVTTADSGGNSNIYDIGLYCVSGTCTAGKLYVHTGPINGSQFAPNIGQFTLPWTGVSQDNPVKLSAGLYALAMGCASAQGECGDTIAQGRAEPGDGRIQPFAIFGIQGFSSSGLPLTFTPPAPSPQILAPKMIDFLFF